MPLSDRRGYSAQDYRALTQDVRGIPYHLQTGQRSPFQGSSAYQQLKSKLDKWKSYDLDTQRFLRARQDPQAWTNSDQFDLVREYNQVPFGIDQMLRQHMSQSDNAWARAILQGAQNSGRMGGHTATFAHGVLGNKQFGAGRQFGRLALPEGDQLANMLQAWQHRGVQVPQALLNYAMWRDMESRTVNPSGVWRNYVTGSGRTHFGGGQTAPRGFGFQGETALDRGRRATFSNARPAPSIGPMHGPQLPPQRQAPRPLVQEHPSLRQPQGQLTQDSVAGRGRFAPPPSDMAQAMFDLYRQADQRKGNISPFAADKTLLPGHAQALQGAGLTDRSGWYDGPGDEIVPMGNGQWMQQQSDPSNYITVPSRNGYMTIPRSQNTGGRSTVRGINTANSLRSRQYGTPYNAYTPELGTWTPGQMTRYGSFNVPATHTSPLQQLGNGVGGFVNKFMQPVMGYGGATRAMGNAARGFSLGGMLGGIGRNLRNLGGVAIRPMTHPHLRPGERPASSVGAMHGPQPFQQWDAPTTSNAYYGPGFGGGFSFGGRGSGGSGGSQSGAGASSGFTPNRSPYRVNSGRLFSALNAFPAAAATAWANTPSYVNPGLAAQPGNRAIISPTQDVFNTDFY